MATGKMSMTVIDLRYDGEEKSSPQAFVVTGATNMIRHRIGEYLSADQVQSLIRASVNVTIKPNK
jgi:hypothetical protein